MIKVIKKTYSLVFKYAPFLFILIMVVEILHGLSQGLITLVTQNFFDAVAKGIEGEVVKSAIIISLIILGGVSLAREILNGIVNYVYNIFDLKVVGVFLRIIHEKIGRIDAINFENTDFLDTLEKVRKGIRGSLGFLFISSSIFTFYLPYFIFMGWYLFIQDPLVAFSLVFIFIPTVINQFLRIKVFKQLEDESAPLRRQADYFDKCITDREYFKETRILGAYGYFKKLYSQSMTRLISKEKKAEKKTGSKEITMKLVTLAGYFAVLILLVHSLYRGRISVGAFSAILASLGRMFLIMEEIISRNFGRLTRSIGTVKNFVDFFDFPEKEGKEDLPSLKGGIQLNDVHFSYPGSDGEALSGIDLTIKEGETLAIVGENGSGKSTLVRLITGLYLPKKGSVKWSEQETSQFNTASLFGRTSAVFQKFQKYKLSLEDNIAMSDLNNVSTSSHTKQMEKAADQADLDMPFDTILSREFGGTDLSGGEWQRVAIARGFYREHDLIVLDEPTAAIDPLEEKTLFEKFSKIAMDKTALIVTHRLGSVKQAHRIIVLDKGKIVEEGTHQELIDTKGQYAQMFSEQAKWYERG